MLISFVMSPLSLALFPLHQPSPRRPDPATDPIIQMVPVSMAPGLLRSDLPTSLVHAPGGPDFWDGMDHGGGGAIEWFDHDKSTARRETWIQHTIIICFAPLAANITAT